MPLRAQISAGSFRVPPPHPAPSSLAARECPLTRASDTAGGRVQPERAVQGRSGRLVRLNFSSSLATRYEAIVVPKLESQPSRAPYSRFNG